MSALRQSARGAACALQIHPYCNRNPETTVLAHLPSIRAGVAKKSPDWWAVHACSDCHDIIDGRRRVDLPKDEIDRCILRGLFLTWISHIDGGLIDVRT